MKTFKITLLAIITLIQFSQVKAQNTNSAINKIISDYLDVKNTLFSGDGNATQAKAKVLYTVIAGFPVKAMSQDQKTIWAKYADKLQFDSRHISETNAIGHQREHFASLSNNMFTVVKALKVNSTTIYQQYCPMKKAYWLSETQDIKNPYYGAEMADCGKITETLKPVTK
ncbi:DUF3347 domain-containing protein [Mucilaginibacter sp. HMF5004]|uniref:DUF3347 domain-containing protein n=1 Tax=Mucilaginibacter rivuli TaxID=2857527 RepID=UPI001C5EEDF9|nr:DUF3347 domain-containing protein [Mucilaginibacter rivuli]MBW4890434.1 DUF3347 domain-containing protein [Mucilaginibacter rivuli]